MEPKYESLAAKMEATAAKQEAKGKRWLERFLELTKSRKHTKKKAYAIIAKEETRDRGGRRPSPAVVERTIKSLLKGNATKEEASIDKQNRGPQPTKRTR